MLAGCADPADQVARARIFAEASGASETGAPLPAIDPARLAEDGAARARVLSMRFWEAGARAGAIRTTAILRFAWSVPGRSPVAFTEERLAERTASGDLHCKVDTDRSLGMEAWLVQGAAYARERHAPPRPRPRTDRAQAEMWADQAYGALRTFDALLGGALRLTLAGEKQVGSRKGVRYSVDLGDPAPAAVASGRPPRYPGGGPDPDTRLRQAFLAQKKPVSARGELVVEAQTAVPLSADLAARLIVPGEPTATLDATLVLETRVGVPEEITPPRAEPLPDRPPTAGVPPSLGGRAEKAPETPAEREDEGEEP